MKKDMSVYNLAVFSQLEPQDDNHRPVDPEPEVDDTMLKNILDEIFTVDEVSGFPKGDIQYYMSSAGNPVVKSWLENNILKPRMTSGSSVEGLTDDLIVECSRIDGESVSDYQKRLTSIYDSAKAEYDKLLQPKNE